MKEATVLLFALGFVCTVFAQAGIKIKGCLIDDEKHSVGYATVQLLSLPDSTFLSGTISNEDGTFLLESPQSEESCFVRISFVGYRTIDLFPVKPDLGMVVLHRDTKELDNVVVVGDRPVYKLEGSSLMTTIANTLLSDVGNAEDVLKYIPGMGVQGQNLIVLGKGEPIYYINNRLVRDKSELKQLKSRDIDKVELITNPGAEYPSETNAVIRIKTKTPQGEGLSGTIDAGGYRSSDWSYNGEARLNYRIRNLDIFGMAGYTGGVLALAHAESDLSVFGQQPWRLFSIRDNRTDAQAVNGNVGFNYTVGKDHSFGAQYKITSDQPDVTGYTDNIRYREGMQNDTVRTQVRDGVDHDFHYVNAYYNGMVNESFNIDFNFDAVLDLQEKMQQSDEQSSQSGNRVVNSWSSSKNYLYAGKLLLSYQLGKNRFLLGGEYNNITNKNLYTNEQQIVENSDTRTTENKGAVFLSYAFKTGAFSIQAGVRYEHTRNVYYDKGIRDNELSKRYNNVLPNVSFAFPAGEKVNMSVAYSQKIRRPSFRDLNGSVNYHNPFLLGSGNPKLKPTLDHDLTWQALYRSYRLAVAYVYTKDYIVPIRRIYGEDESMTLQTSENIDHYQTLNVSFTASPTIGLWHPMFNFNYSQPFLYERSPEGYRHFNNPVFSLSLYNQFVLPKEFVLSANIYMTSAGNSYATVRRESDWGTDLSLRKTFLNKSLLFDLGIYDLFKTRRFLYTRYNATNVITDNNTWDSRTAYLRVTYYFNRTNDKYKGMGAAGSDLNRLK